MADFQRNFMDSLQGGMQLGQQFKSNQDRSTLASLAQQAYTAPKDQQQGLLAQMAGVDPGAAREQEQQFQSQEDRQREILYNLAKGWQTVSKSTDPTQKQQYYERFIGPGLDSAGIPRPAAYDENEITSTAQQVLAAFEGAASEGNTIQSQKISDDGFIVNTYRNGRMEKTGQKVDRQAWLRDHEGMAPQVVDKDGNVIDVGRPRGQSVPEPAPTEASLGADMAEIGRKATEYGYKLRAAGVPPEQVQSLQDDYYQALGGTYAGQNPGAVIEDGTGVRMGQPATVPSFTAPTPTVAARPSAAQTAAEVANAKASVETSYLPEQERIKTQAALERAREEATIERDSKQATTQVANNTALAVYEQGMKGLTEGLAGTDTGPIVGRLPALTSAQQIADGGVAAMAPILKQMFRAAGEGTFTDKDQDLLMKMLPTRTDTPAAAAVKFANIDRIVRAKLGSGQQPMGGETGGAPPRVQSTDDYNRLPNGAIYMAPDGTQRRKR